ncbi:hypothetical protein V6Z11_D11G264900 [Gossypium hirsutum]
MEGLLQAGSSYFYYNFSLSGKFRVLKLNSATRGLRWISFKLIK